MFFCFLYEFCLSLSPKTTVAQSFCTYGIEQSTHHLCLFLSEALFFFLFFFLNFHLIVSVLCTTNVFFCLQPQQAAAFNKTTSFRTLRMPSTERQSRVTRVRVSLTRLLFEISFNICCVQVVFFVCLFLFFSINCVVFRRNGQKWTD